MSEPSTHTIVPFSLCFLPVPSQSLWSVQLQQMYTRVRKKTMIWGWSLRSREGQRTSSSQYTMWRNVYTKQVPLEVMTEKGVALAVMGHCGNLLHKSEQVWDNSLLHYSLWFNVADLPTVNERSPIYRGFSFASRTFAKCSYFIQNSNFKMIVQKLTNRHW